MKQQEPDQEDGQVFRQDPFESSLIERCNIIVLAKRIIQADRRNKEKDVDADLTDRFDDIGLISQDIEDMGKTAAICHMKTDAGMICHDPEGGKPHQKTSGLTDGIEIEFLRYHFLPVFFL